MPSPVVLKMVNRRLAELTRQYTAIRKGDPRALVIAEELSRGGTVRNEIQRIQEKLSALANRRGACPLRVGPLRRCCDKWISLRVSLPSCRESIQAGLRSSMRLLGLASSRTLYSNQRTHNDNKGERAASDRAAQSKEKALSLVSIQTICLQNVLSPSFEKNTHSAHLSMNG